MRASEQAKQRITDWLRRSPAVRGVLVRGVRFADQTFVSDFDSRDYPAGALELAWRSVADTFQVLTAHRLPPTRLTWVYERSVLHCVRRDDGSILGLFVAKNLVEQSREGVDRLLSEFTSLKASSR
jgi:hypothetical protein